MSKKQYYYSELPPAYDDDVPILITDHKPQSKPRSQTKRRSGRPCCCLLLTLVLSLLCVSAGSYLLYHTYSFYQQPTDYPLTHQKVQYVIKVFYPVQPQDLQQPEEFVEFIVTPDAKTGGDKCSMPDPDRMDCYPGGGSTKQNCETKGKLQTISFSILLW